MTPLGFSDISVRFSNIALMDANSASIFPRDRIGGMAVVTGQSLVVRGQARYNGFAGLFEAKNALVHTSGVYYLIIAETWL